MNTKQLLELIKTLITKTKNDKLKWFSLSDDKELLKPTKQSFLDQSPLAIFSDFDSVVLNDSYYSKIAKGYIFLVAYSSGFTSHPQIKLFVQKLDAEYSSEYCSTNSEHYTREEISELKRLYRIVESRMDSCDDILDDLFDDDV